MQNKLSNLAARLKSSRPAAAVLALQQWTNNKSYAQMLNLLGACGDSDRPVIASAMQEVVAGYPVKWGLPILFFYRGRQEWIELPSSQVPPVENAVDWHWESASFAPSASAGILPHRVQCAIFVMRILSHEAPTVPDEFWRDLFAYLPAGDELRISQRLVLPMPAAIEAGMLMRATAASGRSAATGAYTFLDHRAARWAIEAGQQFRRFIADD